MPVSSSQRNIANTVASHIRNREETNRSSDHPWYLHVQKLPNGDTEYATNFFTKESYRDDAIGPSKYT